MPGILRSVITSAGASSSILRSASSPFAAVTAAYPASSSCICVMRRRLSSSSTTNTFLCLMLPLAMHRQKYGKRGASLPIRFGGQNPSVLLYDLVRHRESQPRAGLLGGKKRVENTVPILRADPASLIPHLNQNPPAAHFAAQH